MRINCSGLAKNCCCSFLLLIFACACSTSGKPSGDIFDIRKQAEAKLDLGNKLSDRGSLDDALFQLNEAMRLAVITDDANLRIRSGLSRSNVLFALGRQEEAEAGWNEALAEATAEGNAELAAVCRIHIARGKLFSRTGKDAARQLKDELNRDLALIKSDKLYTAFAWNVIGIAEKELGGYAGAEAAVKRSLEIHEKGRYFELAAYDWFLIASFRSLSGDYGKAKQALETAIAFDRRVENSWGLANDWWALGDVLTKASDRQAARAAYLRSAAIYRGLGNDDAAEEILSRIGD
jgi:tetratricopeptide (TPR) repeat protein